MNRRINTLIAVLFLLGLTNCSTTPEYTYSYCGHSSNHYYELKLIRNGRVEVLKLSSTLDDYFIDSIRVQGGVKYFTTKITYPEIAKRAGVEGIVGAEFIVDTLGNAINLKIIKGIGAGCDEALLMAIKNQKFVYQSNFSEKFNDKIYLLVRFKLY